jgi:hypothetical protein
MRVPDFLLTDFAVDFIPQHAGLSLPRVIVSHILAAYKLSQRGELK